mmetsp:Transcript_12670/g.27430  ORF Transcript_12670/g.27430 Transcript_12670/m.27430 type:complete len:468 (-) Transcript_12670:443-1846(-)
MLSASPSSMGTLTELRLLDSLHPLPYTPAWFNALCGLSSLRSLHLPLAPTHAHLEMLAPLTRLQHLQLCSREARGCVYERLWGGVAGQPPHSPATGQGATDTGVGILAANFPQLRRFNISHVTSSQITTTSAPQLGSRLTQLTHLDLAGCSRVNHDEGLRELAPLVHLQVVDLSQSLNLTDVGLLQLGGATQLKVLRLVGCWKVTFVGVASLWPHLHTLDLSETKAGDEALRDLAASAPALRVLRMFRQWAVTRAGGLEALAAPGAPPLLGLDLSATNLDDAGALVLCSLTSLRYLNISKTHVGDRGCGALAAALRHLRYMRMDRLTRLTDVGVQAMAQAGMPSLRGLRMQHCRNLTEPYLLQLNASLPRLQTMDVQGCWYVGMTTMDALYHNLSNPAYTGKPPGSSGEVTEDEAVAAGPGSSSFPGSRSPLTWPVPLRRCRALWDPPDWVVPEAASDYRDAGDVWA